MKIKRSRGEVIFEVLNTAFLSLLMIVALYPFLYVVFASFSSPGALSRHRGLLFAPLEFSTVAYEAVFKNPNILSGYGNTMLYLAVGLVINMVMTIIGAYALSRKTLYLRNGIMFAIVFTMLFSGGMIPNYILVRELKLMDSLWALTIPYAINTTNLIIMRTAFAQLPDSLEESAKIDGANDLVILARIAVPLAQATIMVLVLYYAVYHWNSWFPAAIYMRSRTKWPLQLILREILIENQTDSMMGGTAGGNDRVLLDATIKYATIIIATVPILVAYPMLQKYFIKGVMIGAIKG